MILVPLFDLKFLNELAAGGVGTSNRRHQRPPRRKRGALPAELHPVELACMAGFEPAFSAPVTGTRFVAGLGYMHIGAATEIRTPVVVAENHGSFR